MGAKQTHLLIGGAGFIGRHVAAGLLQRGYDVIIADRVAVETDRMFGAPDQLKSLIVELASVNWDELVRKSDVVHFYAWSSLPASANANPFGDLNANLGVILGLLEALRRKEGARLVFSSSGGTVYGRTSSAPISERQNLAPVTAYGASKATAEIYLGLYRDLHNLDCRIARISNPYGAGQDISRGQGAIMTFLHKALNCEEIVIWGDGEVTRDYIHISDLIKAMIKIATLQEISRPAIFNIGSGQGLSLNDIISTLERRLGRRLKVQRQKARSFDVAVNILDISNAYKALSWSPALPFADGLDRTIDDLAKGRILSSLD